MSKELIDQKPVVPAHCPVCGDVMLSFQKYCSDCEKHKRLADSARKEKARNHKFGSIFGDFI